MPRMTDGRDEDLKSALALCDAPANHAENERERALTAALRKSLDEVMELRADITTMTESIGDIADVVLTAETLPATGGMVPSPLEWQRVRRAILVIAGKDDRVGVTSAHSSTVTDVSDAARDEDNDE